MKERVRYGAGVLEPLEIREGEGREGESDGTYFESLFMSSENLPSLTLIL